MFFRIAVALAAFLGLAQSNPCAPDGSCPAGLLCNEFKRCIAGAPAKVKAYVYPLCFNDFDCAWGWYCEHSTMTCRIGDRAKSVHNGVCKSDGSCPPGQHCHKLKRCIDKARFKGDSVKCSTSADCSADHHCNEFHYCIPGVSRDTYDPCDGVECPPGFNCNPGTGGCI